MSHRACRRTRILGAFLLLFGLPVFAASARGASVEGAVVVLPTSGVVDPIMANYLAESIADAATEGAAAVVIRLNTPGGSLEATQRIVSTLLEADVPTIVWIAPSGAHAASAGTFITLAANLSFMAPATRIGAATPVGGQGEDIEGALGDKVRNDTIAWVRGIAEVRERPVDWAIATVDEARSSTASEAVELGAVDGIATSLEEVLAAADGRDVAIGGRTVTLDLAGVAVIERELNPFQGFLHLLADPNIAFILFTIGFYGLLFELQNPNFVTGILGALCILLAFVGFGSLPLNVAGLLLIGFGVVLLALEVTVTSHGLLAVAGVICFALGASALYTEPGPFSPDVGVALPLLVVVTATTALFAGLITVAAIRTRRMPAGVSLIGQQPVPGLQAEVRAPLVPIGSVYVAGEEWTARATDDRPIARGTPVRIVRIDGLTVVVEPDPSQAPN